ncbi:MAG: hypothetical protein HQL54_02620 [Magnetococcales bacterium]|nr:hypothetical protein [Magnetococcales bacterium]
MFTLYFSIFIVMMIIGLSINHGRDLKFALVVLDSIILFVAVTMLGGAFGIFDLLYI